MKTTTVMNVRRHLGEILDEVRLKSETFIVERAGKPIARISPLEQAETPADAAERRVRAVREAAGMYATSPRAADIDAWLDKERDRWGER
jgi:antitoxin (DNA-binding transcriptional repressor) of toxin-antitoxin stability system